MRAASQIRATATLTDGQNTFLGTRHYTQNEAKIFSTILVKTGQII
jgi:hypothetical protein